MRATQSGLATVEFAVVGAASLTVLLGCIEVARMLYVWNSVSEATRRAARVAAICPVDDPAITRAAMLNSTGADLESSRFLYGLTPSMVSVTYLDESGGTPAGFPDIRYVRVAISGYVHNLLIPYVSPTVNVPAFSTTVATESLGYIPETGLRTCLSG